MLLKFLMSMVKFILSYVCYNESKKFKDDKCIDLV